MSHFPILLQIAVPSIDTSVCWSEIGSGLLLQMINFALVATADILSCHSSILRFQLPFKMLAVLPSSSCYCSTPYDLLICGHIITSDTAPVWPFSSYICRFRQNVVAFNVFAPQSRLYFQLLLSDNVVTSFTCMFVEHLTTLDFNNPAVHTL
jgi:hypothetical protein